MPVDPKKPVDKVLNHATAASYAETVERYAPFLSPELTALLRSSTPPDLNNFRRLGRLEHLHLVSTGLTPPYSNTTFEQDMASHVESFNQVYPNSNCLFQFKSVSINRTSRGVNVEVSVEAIDKNLPKPDDMEYKL